MLFCIDIGNTNIVMGVFDDSKLLASFRLESNLSKTADEYGVLILEMFKYNHVDSSKVTGVIISSVVPSLDSTFEKLIKKYFKLNALFVGPGIKTGIKIITDNPKQVGADIIVGAVAACQNYGNPVIVIDMGTAITLFYVNESKELIGGIITPGIKTSFQGLFKNTSRLEETRLNVPTSVIGRDTASCIQSAMVYGTASLIDGLIRKMKKEIGSENIKVVLTGGEARFIRNYLEEDVIYDEDLLMTGLKLIYRKNQ